MERAEPALMAHRCPATVADADANACADADDDGALGAGTVLVAGHQ